MIVKRTSTILFHFVLLLLQDVLEMLAADKGFLFFPLSPEDGNHGVVF